MSSQFDADEIPGKLKTHRKNILLELRRNGELYTGELRDGAGVPTGSKNYHLDLLQEWGLIELVDRADDGERVFGLTDHGASFVNEHLGDDDQGLEQRIAELEREVEQLREEKADQEETEDRLDQIREDLQGTYWSAIINEIDERVADAQ